MQAKPIGTLLFVQVLVGCGMFVAGFLTYQTIAPKAERAEAYENQLKESGASTNNPKIVGLTPVEFASESLGIARSHLKTSNALLVCAVLMIALGSFGLVLLRRASTPKSPPEHINRSVLGILVGLFLSLSHLWLSTAKDFLDSVVLNRMEKLPEAQGNALWEVNWRTWQRVFACGSFLHWVGIMLIAFCMCTLIWARLFRSPDDAATHRKPLAGILAVSSGLFFCWIVILTTIPFAFVPRGLGIRPMGWASLMFELAGVALIPGLALSTISAILGEPRKLWFWGIVLSLTPLPLSIMLLRLISLVFGVELEP